ncbi:MAG: hypothetical protein KDD35_03375, partial [Bdellovibrionales bacterium]|nr:hypothetical protein [Bdellovibrionales bacterium]
MSGRGLKLSFYLLTPLLLVAFLFFQNCNGGFDSKEIGVKSALRLNTGLSPSTIRIWQLNRVIATNLPIVLYVNPLIFPEEEDDSSVMENEVTALYTWFYEFDGLNSGCDQKRYENLASAVELSCSRPGNLSVELYIVKSTGEVIELKTNVIVLDDSLLEPKEIEPLLNSIDYLVVDIHGTPGGLADSSGSESN